MSQDVAEAIGIETFTSEEIARMQMSIARQMYDPDSGLLFQADLVSHYGAAQELATNGQSENGVNTGDFYDLKALSRCLVAVDASNLLTLPAWHKLGIDGLIDPLDSEAQELWIEGLQFWINARLSGQIPLTESDLDLILINLQAMGKIIGSYDSEYAKEQILSMWNKGYGYTPGQIGRWLFRSGAKDVVTYNGKNILQDFEDEADWLYRFHVLKLIVSYRLMDQGVKAFGLRPSAMDKVFVPTWPSDKGDVLPTFSEGMVYAHYVAHEAKWIDDNFFVGPNEQYEDDVV